MHRDSGDGPDSGSDDTMQDWQALWDAEDDDTAKLAGMGAYERALRLRDRTDREELRW